MFRSIESALAMEFVIDAATIWAALRPVSKIRLGRLLFASAISSVFSVAVLLVSAAPFIRALLALIAAPVLPLAAIAVMIVRCCRSAFRAQTA